MSSHELFNPKEDLQRIQEVEKTLFAYRYAGEEIGCLAECIDPKAAIEPRSEVLAFFVERSAETMKNPELGRALERLSTQKALLNPMQAAQIKILQRDRKRLTSIPIEDQAAFTRLSSKAQTTWREAKRKDDWESFEPYLDQLVDAQKRAALAMEPEKEAYDTLLNEYEFGANRAMYDAFFADLKNCVVPLLKDCMQAKRTLNTTAALGNFDAKRQWDLAQDLISLEGLNPDALWVGETEHPYTGSPSSKFVILTGHVYTDNILSNIFSILHEGGHALYEQHVNADYDQTSLGGGTSSGMHESQSRLFENYVGRSEEFSEPLLALLRKHFPGQFGRVTATQLYQAENRAEPSLIRVDADELTYPLHIMVRYELEQLLFSGEATAKDIPSLWADKYREYLGVEVPNNKLGALQDIHWSQGYFGYFPTYALGSAIAAQLMDSFTATHPQFPEHLRQGNTDQLRAWLAEHIWQWGRAKDTAELLVGATGKAFDPSHFTRYLGDKYTKLYGLS